MLRTLLRFTIPWKSGESEELPTDRFLEFGPEMAAAPPQGGTSGRQLAETERSGRRAGAAATCSTTAGRSSARPRLPSVLTRARFTPMNRVPYTIPSASRDIPRTAPDV